MSTHAIENYVISLLDTTFPGRSQKMITKDTDLVADLDADSMAMVSLIFAIDEEFAVGTDQLGELVVNCRTVGDLVSATERLQHAHV
jgi:acyl carrier protein